MKKLILTTLTILMLIMVLASTVLAAPSTSNRELLLKASLETTETQRAVPPTVFVNGTGSGNATQLGLYAMSYEAKVTIPTLVGVTHASLVAADGSTIIAEGNGQGTLITPPFIVSIVETYTIAGGTGRFEGASGSFTVERVLNRATGVSSGTISGTIVLP
jgi:hypothetical protein